MVERKGRNIIGLLLVLFAIAACIYVALYGWGETRQGSAKNIKLGLDLAGGVSITYQVNEDNPSAEDMSDTIYKLQNRVSVYSTEAEVYQEGDNRINVEIPGVYDAEAVLEDLGNPGKIQFFEETSAINPNVEIDPNPDYEGDYFTSLGFNEVINGDDVLNARVGTEQDKFGNSKYIVQFTLNGEGTKKFAEATARNIGKPIYIVYDNKIISAPSVNTAIDGGEAVINGDFDYESANALATTIRLGVLKLTLSDIRSNVVGAKLGEDAIQTSLLAAMIGIAIVILFMIIFYRIPGLASGIALVLYIAAMLCFLNALNVTLTLPGIAGIILSIGMAVDANVIIFTRIKEEIAKGKTVRSSIKIGFNKAMSAIVDGNITTLIAAAVLYIMGTGTIKGFAITLALGIVLSMFTALVVTRLVLNGLFSLGFRSVKFYGVQKERNTLNFIGHKRVFYAISIVVIVVGFVFMGVHKFGSSGKILNYSLDFTGGSSMTVDFNEYIDITGTEGIELQKVIEETAGTSEIQLQNVTGTNQIVVKMPEIDAATRTNLKEILVDQYDVDASTISEESISGIVSKEMKSDAIISVIVAGICMLIYIWIRFKDIKFGASAVLALLHDVLIVLMVYAVVRIPVGNTFIACMLTIVGYSINATIVVFDRIRENRVLLEEESLEVIVNSSITQTISRSINTSITTFITVFVLYILGVSSIRDFALPLMAGIVGGAWSSICITGTLWYMLKKRFNKKEETEAAV